MIFIKTYHTTTLLFFMLLIFTHSASADKAIFAGGCFWCMESDFQDIDGVQSVVSGYTGGHLKNPSYKQVSHTDTGHFEAIKILYDPDIISYQKLLAIYWINIDPFDNTGQFCDKGTSYKTAIFPVDSEQRALAEESKILQQQTFKDRTIVTPIIDASTFYTAEHYHQDYYQKNPVRYKYYRWNCGRDARLQAVWGANR